jgi:crossover junction endodeoxyribonuclease RusA
MKFELFYRIPKSKTNVKRQRPPTLDAKGQNHRVLRATAVRAGRQCNCTPYSKRRPCGLVVTIYAPTKRRLDPPNFYPTVKALVDGLTDAGIWTDDNSEVIKFMLLNEVDQAKYPENIGLDWK